MATIEAEGIQYEVATWDDHVGQATLSPVQRAYQTGSGAGAIVAIGTWIPPTAGPANATAQVTGYTSSAGILAAVNKGYSAAETRWAAEDDLERMRATNVFSCANIEASAKSVSIAGKTVAREGDRYSGPLSSGTLLEGVQGVRVEGKPIIPLGAPTDPDWGSVCDGRTVTAQPTVLVVNKPAEEGRVRALLQKARTARAAEHEAEKNVAFLAGYSHSLLFTPSGGVVGVMRKGLLAVTLPKLRETYVAEKRRQGEERDRLEGTEKYAIRYEERANYFFDSVLSIAAVGVARGNRATRRGERDVTPKPPALPSNVAASPRLPGPVAANPAATRNLPVPAQKRSPASRRRKAKSFAKGKAPPARPSPTAGLAGYSGPASGCISCQSLSGSEVQPHASVPSPFGPPRVYGQPEPADDGGGGGQRGAGGGAPQGPFGAPLDPMRWTAVPGGNEGTRMRVFGTPEGREVVKVVRTRIGDPNNPADQMDLSKEVALETTREAVKAHNALADNQAALSQGLERDIREVQTLTAMGQTDIPPFPFPKDKPIRVVVPRMTQDANPWLYRQDIVSGEHPATYFEQKGLSREMAERSAGRLGGRAVRMADRVALIENEDIFYDGAASNLRIAERPDEVVIYWFDSTAHIPLDPDPAPPAPSLPTPSIPPEDHYDVPILDHDESDAYDHPSRMERPTDGDGYARGDVLSPDLQGERTAGPEYVSQLAPPRPSGYFTVRELVPEAGNLGISARNPLVVRSVETKQELRIVRIVQHRRTPDVVYAMPGQPNTLVPLEEFERRFGARFSRMSPDDVTPSPPLSPEQWTDRLNDDAKRVMTHLRKRRIRVHADVIAAELARAHPYVDTGEKNLKTVSVAYNPRTGQAFVALSGDRPVTAHPSISVPVTSLRKDGIAPHNCAEFKAYNAARWAADPNDVIEVYTYNTNIPRPGPRGGQKIKPANNPVEACPNCKVTVRGAAILSDATRGPIGSSNLDKKSCTAEGCGPGVPTASALSNQPGLSPKKPSLIDRAVEWWLGRAKDRRYPFDVDKAVHNTNSFGFWRDDCDQNCVQVASSVRHALEGKAAYAGQPTHPEGTYETLSVVGLSKKMKPTVTAYTERDLIAKVDREWSVGDHGLVVISPSPGLAIIQGGHAINVAKRQNGVVLIDAKDPRPEFSPFMERDEVGKYWDNGLARHGMRTPEELEASGVEPTYKVYKFPTKTWDAVPEGYGGMP